jgi:RNA polymerase sigma-70 factor, ECF subfamily
MCRDPVENMATTSYAAFQKSPNSPDETALILSARQGDLDAFNQLVLDYQERIYNLVVRILGDDYAADDITQNTFLTAYLNLPRFHNGSFRSWLYRIATNACYDVYRLNKRHPVISLENKDFAEERISPLDDFSSPNQLPEIEIERNELARIIQRALDQLDMDQRTVVILVDQQEFDYQEAAQVLGIPVGTVKSRLARARMRLHQILSVSLDNLP